MPSLATHLEVVSFETSSSDSNGDPAVRPEELRLLEAILFAASEPLDEAALAKQLPDSVNVKDALKQLQIEYAPRGVNLVHIGRKWTFRTAPDLSWLLTKETVETRKLSRAAMETLAIIAYHQPVTRPEVEEIRGTSLSQQTLDALLEADLIAPKGRRESPGRPTLWGTTPQFLAQFGLRDLRELPRREDLLLEPLPPPNPVPQGEGESP
jgi:segregation and condensation protein B